MSRISRDQMFMEIAQIVAKRGTCDRAQVGALLIINGRIVSIGYNGSKPGEAHCDDIGHKYVNGHCIRTIHAEINCIMFAYDYVVNVTRADGSCRDATLYVTHLPCDNCCKYIADHNARDYPYFKIKRVVYGKAYPVNISDLELCEKYTNLMKGGVYSVEQFEV